MAEIKQITLTLSVAEARAVYHALGAMPPKGYPQPEQAEAAHGVYGELCRLMEDE